MKLYRMEELSLLELPCDTCIKIWISCCGPLNQDFLLLLLLLVLVVVPLLPVHPQSVCSSRMQ